MKNVFLFSGQGSHHFHMGRELYERDAPFRAAMQHADGVARARCGQSVLAALYDEKNSRERSFDRLLLSHPAIYMVEYALARSLLDRGVQVDLVLGASLGGFAAAAVAGCIDPDVALSAVIEQALALEAHAETGCMVTVVGERERYLTAGLLELCEAGIENFATHTVLSLPQANLAAVEAHLRQCGTAFQKLAVGFAFHSRWIDGAGPGYRGFLSSLAHGQGRIPVVCGAHDQPLHALPADYFWSVVREPVVLPRAIGLAEAQGPCRYIDMSPGGTLATFLKYALPPGSASRVHPVLSPLGGDVDRLAAVAASRSPVTRPKPRETVPAASDDPVQQARERRAMESRPMKAILFPGQGSQFKGMGKDVFPLFPEMVGSASEILGYSLEDLCLHDPQGLLSQTQYTQPALYVVNALHYLRQRDSQPGARPDFLAGHSLGEYNALHAAGVFSFETGLRLVKKRGELMAAASGGGMAAVLGVSAGEIRALLDECALDQVDIANLNTPTQTVVAGDEDALGKAIELFGQRKLRCVRLNVSAAFHSRHMASAQAEFAEFLRAFVFAEPEIPVIANASARPYDPARIAQTLAQQIASPVQWVDSIRYLMGKGELEFQEIGASVLSRMVLEIKAKATPIVEPAPATSPANVPVPAGAKPVEGAAASGAVDAHADAATAPQVRHSRAGRGAPHLVEADALGSKVFRRRYGLRYAYMAGAMYRGVASAELVVRMGKAGLLSFFGAGGLSPERIESNIVRIQAALNAGEPYGMNLLANYEYPTQEETVVELYLKYGIRNVEAAAFMQMTPALVRFRLQGLRGEASGEPTCRHRIVAKVSRPEVARAFMSPAPAHIVERLLDKGQITRQQAEWSQRVPMSHDICVEADSGGHTDGGIAAVMLPPLLRLRDEMQRRHGYAEPICMGLAGGIGGPEAAAAAFLLGADFVATGSINQCTVEAGMSADGKSMLQEIDIQDTDYAPAGDMFEIGAQVQVMKKSVFFPARANKLLSLYRHYERLEDIPPRTRNQLEGTFFKKTFDEIWNETVGYFESARLEHEIAKAQANAKHKMALVFRWYFAHCTRLAIEGKGEDRVNYQIQTGPALGSFNQWVKGTALEPWTQRHVDQIAVKLMDATAEHLTRSFALFAGG